MANKQIIIDLSKARNPQELDIDNIIQKEAQDKFGTILKRIMDGNGQDKNFRRFHNTITINGGRGTGKTTFLLNAIKDKDKDKEDGDGKYDELISGIKVLDIIDPTLVEDKEHVFVAIISNIKDVVDKFREERDNKCSDSQFKYWNEKLRKLSRGLCLLDGVGSDPLKKSCWDDPDFVLQEGLKNASSGAKLEKAFHDFVAESLTVIGKKAFLLRFDDIDTNFERGWAVLEIIRKYLTTTQIITVLSGDMELYSKLVRKNQWENFGKTFTDNESKDKFSPIVDKLEEQYLMKILKPENRIELQSLKHYSDIKDLEIYVKEIDGSKKILEVFEEICRVLFGIVKSDFHHIKLFINCLLRQPVRTVIEVLLAHQEYKIKMLKTPEGEKQFSGEFTRKVAFIFLTILYKFKYTISDIENILDPNRCEFGELTQKLAEFNMLEDNYKLLPEDTDETTNILMIVLSGLYSQAMRGNPKLMLDYMIKLGLPREIWAHHWRTGQRKLDKDFKTEFKEDIIPFLHLDKQELSLQVSRRFTAFKGNADLKEHDHGIVNVKSLDKQSIDSLGRSIANLYNLDHISKDWHEAIKQIEVQQKSKCIEPIERYFDKVKESKNKKISELIIPPMKLKTKIEDQSIANIIDLLFSYRVEGNQNKNTRLFYSFYNLLAFILDSERLIDYKGIAQIRYFPAYNAELSVSNLQESENPKGSTKAKGEDEAEDDEFDDKDIDTTHAGNDSEDLLTGEIFNVFKVWLDKRKDLPKFPVHLWANIWTRFFYTLKNISFEKIKADKLFLGEIIHRDIVAFLHAVLVEESFVNGEDLKTRNYDNPVGDDRAFTDKIKKINFGSATEGKSELIAVTKMPLFSFLFSCPFWKTFMSKRGVEWESSYDTNLKEYLKRNKDEDLNYLRNIEKGEDLSLYDILNAVPITLERNTPSSSKVYSLLKAIEDEDFCGICTKHNFSQVFDDDIESNNKMTSKDKKEAIQNFFKDGFGLKIELAESSSAKYPKYIVDFKNKVKDKLSPKTVQSTANSSGK